MQETLLHFPIDIGDVLDIDFRADGSVVSVQGHGKRQILVHPTGHCELPADWPAPEYPHLRSVSPGRLLLVDTGSANVNGDNACFLTETGRLERSFHLGAGVIDIVTLNGTLNGGIAVGYHADAAHEFGLETGPLAATGVAIFDETGHMVASLNNQLEADGWTASNIQCMAARESGELVLIPEFLKGPDDELLSPLVFFDWRNGRVRVEESRLSRPLALSTKDAMVLIYSPEESEDELIQCDLKGRRVKSLGFFKHIFRGLPKGRFLAQLSGVEYSTLEMNPDEMKPERKAKSETSISRLARHP